MASSSPPAAPPLASTSSSASVNSASTMSSRPRRPTRSIPPPPIEPTAAAVPLADLPVVHSPAASAESSDTPVQHSDLTPLRAHYLKKSLVQLQFNRELDAITTTTQSNVSTFSYLGPPFSPPPKDAPYVDLPFLRYIFHQFVLTFPFMASAPKDFYSNKLQPFVASVLARNISPTSVFDDNSDNSEQAARLKLLAKIERNLSLFVGAAIKLAEPEEVVRLSQADLDRLEVLSKKRLAKASQTVDIFEVNVVSVRTVVDKGRMRSRAHEEFIIRTRRSHHPDIFVSRRYGDFKTLADELRKQYPKEVVRNPPAKDRTTVSAPSSASASPAATFLSQQAMSDSQNNSTDSLGSPTTQSFTPSRLSREKNRLTLRAYLTALLSTPKIASSAVLKSFLLSGPTVLSSEELEDARRREDADRTREEGRKRFAKEIAGRVEGLRDAVKDVKGDIMGKDGLTQIFATIKVTPSVRDLPSNYRSVLEWARISLASTVFQMLVAADDSSETFASLKRIHGLMPYFMLKTALKVSNPIGMIRSVLDLFLAQPFGGRSLLQRMFTSSLSEEVKALEEDIEAVKDKVDDPIICEKIRQFVYAPREIQDMLKADAAGERLNLLTVILRSGDEPLLSRAQMHRVSRAHRAHALYMKHRETLVDSDDDDGPQDEDAWLFEDLKVLAHLYSRLRDREQIIALIFEGFTSELLKDMITIFYSPLAQVYRAASISDSLGDLQSFINDLIKTVEQVEELSQVDPSRTVQAFIDLIERHEQAFYSFVHKVHSKGEGLFDSLMRWIELFLTVVREGLGSPISLEFLLPHTGPDRTAILTEVDAVASYHYKLKILYEDKLRRRFGKAQGQSDADAEDEATQALVNGVVGEINFGELIQGDADDLAAELDEEDDDESSEYESSSEEDDSETGSESESESNDEEPQRRPAPSRSHTISAREPGSPPPQRVTPAPEMNQRQRSQSFTSRRAMPVRQDTIRPPVPPLPSGYSHSVRASLSKPLPPSPPRGSAERPREAVPQRSRKRGKKVPEVLQPPELQHIPTLLPIFTEMMRPLLRPRQRTSPT